MGFLVVSSVRKEGRERNGSVHGLCSNHRFLSH